MTYQDDDPVERSLARIFASPPGLYGWLTNVNHKVVGLRFMLTSLVFFLIGGVEALLMRMQLTRPSAEIVSPERFGQLFTMHGSTMMFLFALPFLEGLAIYLVPLMIGARDMAFPRLNAFGYFVYLIAGVMLHGSLIAGQAPDAGWYNYVPLAGPGYSTGPNIDYWVTMLTFLEVAALVAAVELIVTIFKQRAPGMSLSRMPPFVWAILVAAFMIVFAMPPLVLASLLLATDRFAGTHFFNVAAGGEPLLWQHLFWFFGHPDVYILLVPALGIGSAIVPVSARRPLVAYTAVVVSTVSIGVISFGLWVHHMYPAGLPQLGMSFFTAASMMITVPSGVTIFAWIATLWRSAPTFDAHFLFLLGFIVLLILGGLTGIMLASVPLDWQVTDTYFVVAHFHYVLIGGVVFPIFGAIHFWWPKMTGAHLHERLGKVTFWLMFVGFNLTFFPMHLVGLRGMARRSYTYLPGQGWELDNILATAGAFVFAGGVFALLFNLVASRLLRAPATPDPWSGGTLEWAVGSPPPDYNFRLFPIVRDLYPLWGERPLRAMELDDPGDVRRETLATTVLDAQPDHRLDLPGPSIWPFWLAVALTVCFLGAAVDLLFVPFGALLAFAALVGWFWPPRDGRGSPEPVASGALPRSVSGSRSTVLWGVAILIVIESMVILSLQVSYFYLRVHTPTWPPEGLGSPDFGASTLATALFAASVVPVVWAERGIARGDQRRLRLGLVTGLGLVVAYGALTLLEWRHRDYTWATNAYASAVWTIGGYQLMHVGVVFLLGSCVTALAFTGYFLPTRRVAVQATALYWYFAAASSLLSWGTVYLAPRLL